MRKFAFFAAALATALALPALAEDTVTGVIASVDAKERVLVLEDKTRMVIADSVDLSELGPGENVTITTRLDEDGYTAATGIAPAE